MTRRRVALLPAVAFACFWMLGSTRATAAEEQVVSRPQPDRDADTPLFVRSSSREIPVSSFVDVVVVGGNEGGLAAGWEAAKSGSSVLLLAGQYFFSDETSSKARYWLEADETPQSEFSKAMLADQDDSLPELSPAKYKRTLDTLLLDAGVAFHFNSKPAGVLVTESGDVAGVLTANKAGLQAVVAKVVIDATPTAAVARVAGAPMTPWSIDQVTVSRTVFNRQVPGARRIGRFREYSLSVAMPSGSWPERCRAEVLLRERFNSVVGNQAHAHELHMVEPVSIVSEASEVPDTWPGATELDLNVCRPRGFEHLFVVSQSAGVDREIAERLTRHVHLADLGSRVGIEAHRLAGERTLPKAIRVRPTGEEQSAANTDVGELLWGPRRYRKTEPGTVSQGDLAIPVWGKYDVIVVGGGTSGLPAALGAGRMGARVLVLEMLGQIGGNRELGTPGYWKGYLHGVNQPKLRATNLFRSLREVGVDIWYNTLACGAVKEAERVTGVVVATHMGRGAVLGDVIIDATGDADICVAAGAQFSYVNDGDLCIQEASFRDLDLYANVLPLDHADAHSLTVHHVLARKVGKQDVWDFYPLVGLRETRLIEGDHVISVLDQIVGRTYRDLISVSQSAYDPHGYHTSDYVYAGLMPLTKHETKEGFVTYIPLRSLLPKGLDGIMVVGRSHSVTHDVQASVRMNADLINEGYAAGCVAAQAAAAGAELRKVDLAPIQDHLAQIGNITEEDRRLRCVDTPEPTDDELRAAAEDPRTKRQLAVLLRGGNRSLAPLQTSFQKDPTLPKAKVLCVLGDTTGVEFLIRWLNDHALVEGQDYQWDAFLSVPEVDSVMWMLGAARDARAVSALTAKLEDCSPGAACFSNVRAVTTALGRIGSPKAAPALYRFLSQDGVHGHVDVAGDPQSLKSEFFVKAYIELHAAAALFRCGDHQDLGRRTLEGYLDDWRGIFVRYAGHTLETKEY